MVKYIALGALSGLAALTFGATMSPIITEMYKDYSGFEKVAGYCAAYALPGVFALGTVLCTYMHQTKDRTQTLEKTTTSSPSFPLKK